MDFQLTEQQVAIDRGRAKGLLQFQTIQYWTDCEDKACTSPQEYYQAMAEGGWLGITMPEDVGGVRPGCDGSRHHDACRRPASNGGYSAASAIHINMFGPHAVVVHGTTGTEGSAGLPALVSRQAEGLLRRDGARCRAGHHQHQDLRHPDQ